jgi:hypothetical protein
MISCRRASLLASKSLDRPLTKWETLMLKSHLLVCGECDHYREQISSLRQTAGHFGDFLHRNGDSLPPLSDAARRRIQDAVKAEQS